MIRGDGLFPPWSDDHLRRNDFSEGLQATDETQMRHGSIKIVQSESNYAFTRSFISVQSVFHPWLEMEELLQCQH
jgi:hypothetical protein